MSYENEVQQAWRRLGPLGERETCEIARNADTQIAALRAELERKDAALKDFAAAWREVAHRSGVKLEAWEDDEYILSAPERGPCGMTIHRRHATVLNAALQPKEPPCQTA